MNFKHFSLVVLLAFSCANTNCANKKTKSSTCNRAGRALALLVTTAAVARGGYLALHEFRTEACYGDLPGEIAKNDYGCAGSIFTGTIIPTCAGKGCPTPIGGDLSTLGLSLNKPNSLKKPKSLADELDLPSTI